MSVRDNGLLLPRFLHGALALLLVLGAALASLSSAVAQSVARAPFSADERARLAAGKLVTRPMTEQRSGLRLIGGASWQLIDAQPDQVLRALLDTERYAQMLPGVSGAALVSEQPTLRRVRIDHKRGPLGVSYRMALQIDRNKREVTFKLNDPLDSSLRAAWGFLSVRPAGPNKTLLSYGVMADPGDGLLVALVRGVMHDWLLKVPRQIRNFIESKAGRARYKSGPAGGGRG